MLVSLKDGSCRCGGQLRIIDADDATMETECTECGDSMTVETDFFNDGGVHYWPHVMANQLEGGDREDD